MKRLFSLALLLLIVLFTAEYSATGQEHEEEIERRSDSVQFLPTEKTDDKKAFAEAFKPRDRNIKYTASIASGVKADFARNRIRFTSSSKENSALVLHMVYFNQEKQFAKHSNIVVNVRQIQKGPAKVETAYYFDWRENSWVQIAPAETQLSFSTVSGRKGYLLSGSITVPPMHFMGEPEGKVVLSENPLRPDDPETLAQTVNQLMKMKPLFSVPASGD